MKLGEKTIVEHTLSALQQCRSLDAIYLATGSGEENYPLKEICQKLGIALFCGSEDNVLQRFWDVVEQEKKAGQTYDYIVRVCADSPFIDASEVDNLIHVHEQQKADLSINYNHPMGLPCGFGVEVISTGALKESVELAETDEHREHLDEWILQHPEKYKIYQHPVEKEKQSYRLYFTIDTAQDFAFMEGVVKEVMKQQGGTFTPLDLLKAVRQNPRLLSPKTMKLFVRADGNGEIGMGHIMRSLTVCRALRDIFPKLDVTYYTVPEAYEKIKEQMYGTKIFEESLFRQDVVNENPDIIITDLRKHLDDSSSEPLNRALKVRFIDSEIARNVRGEVIINSFPHSHFPTSAAYYNGLNYLPLRQEFANIEPKIIKSLVKEIVVLLGGGNVHDQQIQKIMEVSQEFNAIHFTIILGSTIKDQVCTSSFNVTILQDVHNVKEKMEQADIGISGGGNTLFEFARCGVPTISMSSDYDSQHASHQEWYCRAFEDAGTTIYLGHGDSWSNEQLKKKIQQLCENIDLRKRMSAQGQQIIDGTATTKICDIIIRHHVQG